MSRTPCPPDDDPGMNLAVVRGRLSSHPVERRLPSGDPLWSFEVSIRRAGRPTDTVPVVLQAEPPRRFARGDEVVAIGRVRRRFFRAGGATRSSTEVVADQILPVTRAVGVRRALERVAESLRLVSDPAPRRSRP